MKIHTGCFGRLVVVGIWLVAASLILGLCGVLLWFHQQQQDQARAQFAPPFVLVNNPPAGKTFAAGSHAMVTAMSFGGRPIARAELWVDGTLVANDSGPAPEGSSTLYSTFDLLVPLGPHLLFVRGIDTTGSIGQSVPVRIVGEPKPAQSYYSVLVGPGQTWQDLAGAYSTDPATLASLNPNLGSAQPTEGTRVVVPVSPGPPPAPAGAGAAPPGAPPSGAPVTLPAVPPLESLNPSSLTLNGLMLLALPHRPTAPTDLQGQMDGCNIKLRWNDNADNEERYDVWITGGTGIPRVIAALKPGLGGAVWAEITAPEAGNLDLWVEAVNAIGGQPSNIITLSVEAKCAPPPTQLQVEALEITAGGGHDRTYCYVSLQATPEIRIPEERQQFIRVGNGSAAGAGLPKKKFAVPIPADGALDISGECWGWSGKNLDRLGSFGRKFYSDTWNGKPQDLNGTSFKISLVITKQGDADGSRVIYDLPQDPHIPAPYDVKMDSFRGGAPADPKLRALHWKWSSKGDSKIKLTGFAIYRDGFLIQQRALSLAEQANPAMDWEQDIGLEHECQTPWEDPHTRWQVAAETADGVSPLSLPYEYEQTACQQFARVTFDAVYVPCSSKHTHGHFNLIVNGEVRYFWDGNVYTWIDCGKNTFTNMIGNWSSTQMPQAFLIPLDIKSDPNGWVDVRAAIWNDSEDLIGRMKQRYQLGDAGHAQDVGFKCGKDFTVNGDTLDNGYAIFYINITVYPNPCEINPP